MTLLMAMPHLLRTWRWTWEKRTCRGVYGVGLGMKKGLGGFLLLGLFVMVVVVGIVMKGEKMKTRMNGEDSLIDVSYII